MNDFDVNRQWSDLQELYGSMADEELQAVANDGYQLTDIARQALRAEISRRHLDIVLNETAPLSDDEEEPHGDFDPANLSLVTAFRVWDIDEARRVKEALDAAFIPSYLGPDNIENVDQLPAITESGVAVRVREGDSPRAKFATRDVRAPHEKEEEITEYVAHCPKCQSEEIVFEGLGDVPPHHEDAEALDSTEDDDPEADTAGEDEEEHVPDLVPSASESDANAKYNWRCDACGHRWQDDGVEPSQ
jgi:hypothetical protein